jgi:hypothetical protein
MFLGSSIPSVLPVFRCVVAVLAYPGMKGFFTGRTAVRDCWAARFRAARFLEAVIVPAKVRVDGDLASETGTDGHWLIQADALVPDPAG